jgi:hypothetical protein
MPIKFIDELDVNGDLDIGTGSGLDAITSGNGSAILARFDNSTFEYTYGPIVANPASYDFTFQGLNIAYGNITPGFIPVQSSIAGMIDSVISENYASNIGISNSSPSEKLDVSGNVKSNGFIKNGGTSSEFLKADGSTDSSSYLTNSSTYIKNIVSETSGARNAVVGDVNNIIECNSSSDTIIDILNGATSGMQVGDQIMYVRFSTGDVVFNENGGTILALDGNTTITADYGFAVLIYRGSDQYYLTGRLA